MARLARVARVAQSRTERLYLGGAGLAAAVIVLVGWFFLVSPQRSETETVQNQIADAQLQNQTLQGRITQLDAEQRKVGEYAGAMARARQALPARTDMSAFLRTIQQIGTETSATVSSMTVSDTTAVTPVAAVPAAGSAGTPAAAPAAAPAGSGLFAIPITASVTGTDKALSAFLTRLQSGQPRAVLVTGMTRASTGARSTMQLTMTAFVAPEPAAATPTPAPTGGD